MRRQNAWPDDRLVERARIVLEGRERIRVEQRRSPGPQHGAHSPPGGLASSGTRPDEQRRKATVGKQAIELFWGREWLHHDAGQRGSVD